MWQLLMDGTIIKWAYAGGDEFNGSSLNSIKWRDSYPWGRNLHKNKELQYYTQGNNYEFGYNAEIDSETIQLIAKEESIYAKALPDKDDDYILYDGGYNLRWWDYTSGMLFSKQKFKYGLFEIRFKTPYGQGFWPAFWLYAGQPIDEIDVFEMKGEDPNKFKSGCICDNNGNGGNDCGGEWFTATGNFPESFNIMRVDWGPEFIIWSLNAVEYYIWLQEFNYPMSVIANLAIASDDGAFSPGPNSDTPFPSYFEIDFIRVWKRLDCDEVVTISNYSQGANDPTTFTGNIITINNSDLNNDEYLSLIATEKIIITPETSFEGIFVAKIVECPGPTKNEYVNNGILTIHNDTIEQINQINEMNVQNKKIVMTVYPNPTKGIINIEIPFNNNDTQYIKLINSLGVTVFSKDNIEENIFQIDISEYAKGIYFFIALINNKEFIEKIVIE